MTGPGDHGQASHTGARVRSSVSDGGSPVPPSIAQLVGAVYQAAPVTLRGRLLEALLRPLGVLSLFAIAGGVFAKIRLRAGWPLSSVRPEDLQQVRADDVIALVDFAQQVSTETVDGLAQLLASSPHMAGSAAAALLVTLLMQRQRAASRGRGNAHDLPAPAARPDR